ncbi:aquaporin [Mycobacterium sp.]|jgi:aquaporin Z|uniref:MIP/aquaporin family protein n=1 Tax=Mycobacterium sp. TaxID=1785 RepID=UPI00333E6E6E|nr:permease, glycerol uptake facilitator [Mycobacterium sp.]
MATATSQTTRAFELSNTVISGTGRKLVVELIGTFFLVFTVGAAVRGGSSLAPLAIGAVLMVMVYAGGHISGGHYNPAVTIAALVRGRIGAGDAIGYWVTQLVAGLLAAVVVRATVSTSQAHPLAPTGHALASALIVEFLYTFALAYVVLNVATSKDHPDNSFYGLAIGFTVLVGAVSVGAISGGAFNPAVVLGGAAMGLFAWSTVLYLVPQLIAGVAAGVVFRALNPTDK